RRILGNGEIVEPQLRAFPGDRIADGDRALRFRGALLRLLDVAGEADDEADFAAGERIEIFRGGEFAYTRPDLREQRRGLFQVAGIAGIRIELQKMQRRRNDVVGGVEEVNAAILELGDLFRIEHRVPGAHRRSGGRVRSEYLADGVDVVAD